jgi:hypothetical protein
MAGLLTSQVVSELRWARHSASSSVIVETNVPLNLDIRFGIDRLQYA